MARIFNNKNKDLVNLEVVTSDKVWTTYKGEPILRKDLNIYGKVSKGRSAYVAQTNRRGKNGKFVEDTTNLPKKIKQDIVDKFENDNKRVVYLLRKK